MNIFPICLTSVREASLPNIPNWLAALWECCIARSDKGAAPFLSWYARNKFNIIIGTGAGTVVGGVIPGAVVGGLVGTGVIPIPGVGTAAGVVVGSIVGGCGLGAVTGASTVAIGSKVAQKLQAKEIKPDYEPKKPMKKSHSLTN